MISPWYPHIIPTLSPHYPHMCNWKKPVLIFISSDQKQKMSQRYAENPSPRRKKPKHGASISRRKSWLQKYIEILASDIPGVDFLMDFFFPLWTSALIGDVEIEIESSRVALFAVRPRWSESFHEAASVTGSQPGRPQHGAHVALRNLNLDVTLHEIMMNYLSE